MIIPKLTETIQASPDFEERLKAMADRAEYELGDRSWAGILMGAFLHPEADQDALRQALAEPTTASR